MKIAILSDIHGNIDALNQVLKEVDKQKIDMIFCLGDQLGYYYSAKEVYEELRKRNSIIISGNHEQIFLNYLTEPSKTIDEKYGLCFKKYKKIFSDELISFIEKIPSEIRLTIDGVKFSLFHGANFKNDYYVYPTEKRNILDKFDSEDSDVIFIGHTHYPFIFNSSNSLVINVGSVGQSRVIGGISNWGIYDTSNKVYIPKSTPYNIKKVIEKLEEIDSNKYLKTILTRNNTSYE